MDLRARLLRLDPLARRAVAPDDDSPPLPAPRPHDADLRDALGLQGGPDGVWSRHERVAGVAEPGWPPPDLAGILPQAAAGCSGWRDLLFLDTETTGLAGGTGTLAFLVGAGWWEDGGFVVRQLFLPGPDREDALLAELAELAARFSVVVTYNGAAFDLPLLRTRSLLARREDACGGLGCWDLVTASRRIWRRELPDCRQQTVEAMVCGYRRGPGDIDGALIPGVYRAFLRRGATSGLDAVLEHNRRDVAGLGRILAAVLAAAAAVAAGPARGQRAAAATAWSRALICERRRAHRQAAAWIGSVVARGMLADLPLGGVRDAVRLLKRAADWPLAEAALEHGLARWPAEARLHREAAILYEHRLGDLHRALGHARCLSDERRLARLRRRLARGGRIGGGAAS